MDRKYIESEHIVERYLSGDLTVREARDFEQYCHDNPEALKQMPIPVRLKARLARRPQADSETGVFQAIPSSTTRAALESGGEELDVADDDDDGASRSSRYGGGGVSNIVVLGLGIALLIAIAAAAMFFMEGRALEQRIGQLEDSAAQREMQAPGSVQRYRVEPVRAKPGAPTLALGWLSPPQLLDLYIDVSDGKYTQFMITIDRIDGTRVMQVRRIARDSNRELRLGLNSSAFGPGEYLLKIDGYTWRGQQEEIGWVRLGLE